VGKAPTPAYKDRTVMCRLRLDMDHFDQFKRVQDSVVLAFAEKHRPAIELILRNTIDDDEATYRFGVIGGVEQMADSKVLGRLMKIIDSQEEPLMNSIKSHLILHIHSNPPPIDYLTYRPNWQFGTGLTTIEFTDYSRQLTDFLEDYRIRAYMMASTSAHLNYWYIQNKIASPTSDEFGGVNTYINVIWETVNMINAGSVQSDGAATILIIENDKARTAGLFKTAIKGMVPDWNCVEVSTEKQVTLQAVIDGLKQNTISLDDAKAKMMKMEVNLCDELVQNKAITHLLVGSSELSSAITTSALGECGLAEGRNVIYVDTTQMMAHFIFSYIQGEEAKLKYKTTSADLEIPPENNPNPLVPAPAPKTASKTDSTTATVVTDDAQAGSNSDATATTVATGNPQAGSNSDATATVATDGPKQGSN
jgi:hypothetical protein